MSPKTISKVTLAESLNPRSCFVASDCRIDTRIEEWLKMTHKILYVAGILSVARGGGATEGALVDEMNNQLIQHVETYTTFSEEFGRL